MSFGREFVVLVTKPSIFGKLEVHACVGDHVEA